MGRAGRLAALALAAAFLAGCSPVYVFQSASGHAGLLFRRRHIAEVLKDPQTPPSLRAALFTAQDARAFAFDALGLKKSADFHTYVKVDGPAVTWLVSGSRREKLEPYTWWFPFAGRFPYKGYFKKKRALAERDRLEKKGFDAAVFGAAAYNTPLPVSDPLPSSALDLSTGALAALLIHELAHGTVYFKDHTDFDEAAAEFIGRRGARQYLARRFGADSRELADYEKELAVDAQVDEVFERLNGKLTALYSEKIADDEKLSRRQALFDAAQKELAALGENYSTVNNAVVLAHRVYRGDLPFAKLFEELHGDWPKFLATLKGLDKRDPSAALRKSIHGDP